MNNQPITGQGFIHSDICIDADELAILIGTVSPEEEFRFAIISYCAFGIFQKLQLFCSGNDFPYRIILIIVLSSTFNNLISVENENH